MGHKIEELTAEGIKKKLEEVRSKEELKFRVFIANSFPALSACPTIFSRMCLYCDSLDGDFLIDYDPDYPGLFVVRPLPSPGDQLSTSSIGKWRLWAWLQIRARSRRADSGCIRRQVDQVYKKIRMAGYDPWSTEGRCTLSRYRCSPSSTKQILTYFPLSCASSATDYSMIQTSGLIYFTAPRKRCSLPQR